MESGHNRPQSCGWAWGLDVEEKRNDEDLKLAYGLLWPTWFSGSLVGGFLELGAEISR